MPIPDRKLIAMLAIREIGPIGDPPAEPTTRRSFLSKAGFGFRYESADHLAAFAP